MKQIDFEFFIGELCGQLRARGGWNDELASCLDDALAHLKEQQAKLAAQQRADNAVREQ